MKKANIILALALLVGLSMMSPTEARERNGAHEHHFKARQERQIGRQFAQHDHHIKNRGHQFQHNGRIASYGRSIAKCTSTKRFGRGHYKHRHFGPNRTHTKTVVYRPVHHGHSSAKIIFKIPPVVVSL